MSTNSDWVTFFDAHSSIYDENIFTKNTLYEVDFLLEELQLAPGARILDIGCGTGRHSIELAKRGYRMTGLDISTGMLAQAQAKAAAAGVAVEWVHGDATSFSFATPFDAIFCLCEGSFGLLSAGDDALAHPLAILRNASQCLRQNGKTLFTVLNGYRMIRNHTQDDVAQQRFDPLTLAELSVATPCEGVAPVTVYERGFIPTELNLLFGLAGMTVTHMWGGTAGSWQRSDINLDEFEIMVVAEKKSELPINISFVPNVPFIG